MCYRTEFTDSSASQAIRAAMNPLMSSELVFYPETMQADKAGVAEHFLVGKLRFDCDPLGRDAPETDF